MYFRTLKPSTKPKMKLNRTTGLLLKERVRALKPLLPKDWRFLVIARHPEYDTLLGATVLNNVVYLRNADLRVIEILERIIAEGQAGNNEAGNNEAESPQQSANAHTGNAHSGSVAGGGSIPGGGSVANTVSA